MGEKKSGSKATATFPEGGGEYNRRKGKRRAAGWCSRFGERKELGGSDRDTPSAETSMSSSQHKKEGGGRKSLAVQASYRRHSVKQPLERARTGEKR